MFWIPAVIISHLTGGQDMSSFNIQLLAPFIQKMLPMKYRHTELRPIEKKISNLNEEGDASALKQEISELLTKNKGKELNISNGIQ